MGPVRPMTRQIDDAHMKARLMIAERKSNEQIFHDTGVAVVELGPMRGFMNSPVGKAWLRKYQAENTKPGAVGSGTTTTVLKDQKGSRQKDEDLDGDEDEEVVRTSPGKLDKVQLFTDEAKRLRDVFKSTLGISSPQAIHLLAEVDRNPDFFLDHQDELITRLHLIGLSNQRTDAAAHTWVREMRELQASRSRRDTQPAQIGGDVLSSLDSLIQYEMKMDFLDRIKERRGENSRRPRTARDELRERLAERRMDRLDNEEVDEELHGKLNKQPGDSFFDEARKLIVTKSVFRDEAGAGQSPTTLMEYETEFIPLLDEKGHELKDQEGVTLTRRVERKRPVETQAVRMRQAVPEDPEEDRWMDKIVKWTFMKSMIMGPMGMGMGMGMPGMNVITEMIPVLDEEGKPLLDKMGQVVALPRTTPITGANQTPQFDPVAFAEKQTDSVIRLAEVLRGGKNDGPFSPETILKTALDQADKANAAHLQVLEKQVEAYQKDDPLANLADTVEKLGTLGFSVGGQQTDNLEVVKLTNDLQKYKIDKDDEWRKFVNEQDMRKQDKEFAADQMNHVAEVIKQGIETIGGPLANGFKEGLVIGAQGKAAAAQTGQPAQPAQQQASGPIDQERIRKMSNEELIDYLAHVNSADKVVAATRTMVVAEMTLRGVQV